jgi:hypothetical protein
MAAAGTLFGLGLSQPLDLDGKLMPGCKLEIYTANSSTPVNVYKDTGLTDLHPWPLVADGNGRIPAFWIAADIFYRARLLRADDEEQFDEPSILAIGQPVFVAPPAPTVIGFETGDVKWRPVKATLTGWAVCNGQTIGLAGASQINGTTAFNLYKFIWQNISSPSGNVNCRVLSGSTPALGLNADDDWANGSLIELPDMRSRAPYGLDDMGASPAGLLSSIDFTDPDNGAGTGSAIIPASKTGLVGRTLLIGNMPAHAHDALISDPGHFHNQDGRTNLAQTGSQGPVAGAPAGMQGGTTDTRATGIHVVPDISGAPLNKTSIVGGGSPIVTMDPLMVGTWYMRL